jgi:hypothetical protein
VVSSSQAFRIKLKFCTHDVALELSTGIKEEIQKLDRKTRKMLTIYG